MMLTAGVGCAKLEPAAEPMTSTMITATSPRASPRTIAAGAIQSRQSGWSCAGRACGASTVSVSGTGRGGGMLVIGRGG